MYEHVAAASGNCQVMHAKLSGMQGKLARLEGAGMQLDEQLHSMQLQLVRPASLPLLLNSTSSCALCNKQHALH